MLTHDLGVALEVMRENQQTEREAGIIFQVYLSWNSKGAEMIEWVDGWGGEREYRMSIYHNICVRVASGCALSSLAMAASWQKGQESSSWLIHRTGCLSNLTLCWSSREFLGSCWSPVYTGISTFMKIRLLWIKNKNEIQETVKAKINYYIHRFKHNYNVFLI